jgi:hypothetical protein
VPEDSHDTRKNKDEDGHTPINNRGHVARLINRSDEGDIKRRVRENKVRMVEIG